MWNDFVSSPLSTSPINSFGKFDSWQEMSDHASKELDDFSLRHCFIIPEGHSESIQPEVVPTSLTPTMMHPTSLVSNPYSDMDSYPTTVAPKAQMNTEVQSSISMDRRKRMRPTEVPVVGKTPLVSESSEKLNTNSASKPQVLSMQEPMSVQSRYTRALGRKNHKMADKIATLQQLVSPFGKTDTASVLHETAACIKTLHSQIQAETAPYFGMQPMFRYQGYEEQKINLRSRGLCLVPISSLSVNKGSDVYFR